MRILPIIDTNYQNKNNFKVNYRGGAAKLNIVGLSNNPLPKITPPLISNKARSFVFRDISDEGFYALIHKIKDCDFGLGLYTDPDDGHKYKPFAYKSIFDFSKWSVQLLDHINTMMKGLDKEDPTYKLCQEYVKRQFRYDNQPVKTKEAAELTIRTLRMPWLFMTDGKPDLVYFDNINENEAKVKNKLFNMFEKNQAKVIEIKNDYQNVKDLRSMIFGVTSEKALDVVEKMIQHPEVLDKPYRDNFDQEFFKSISENDKHAEIVSEFIDKILLNPELLEKENSDEISFMLKYTKDDYRKEFLQKLIDNPDLFDKQIMRELALCLHSYPNKDIDDHRVIREYLNKHLDLLIANPDLAENDNLASHFRLVDMYDPYKRNPKKWLHVLADDIMHKEIFYVGGYVHEFV